MNGVINTVGDVNANQPRLIKCYSCKGEGYIAKQCTTKRRAKDSECFKEKMLLAQAHESRVVLHEEQQDFLADSLSHADSINGDIVGPTYDSDILFEVPHYDTYHEIDMLNLVIQEMEF
ncbi:retrovirus-related pol polyprotein from transposon TNT 1-94, partial [Tanacetum coccineum]